MSLIGCSILLVFVPRELGTNKDSEQKGVLRPLNSQYLQIHPTADQKYVEKKNCFCNEHVQTFFLIIIP